MALAGTVGVVGGLGTGSRAASAGRAPRSISCSPMANGKLCSISCDHRLSPERGCEQSAAGAMKFCETAEVHSRLTTA